MQVIRSFRFLLVWAGVLTVLSPGIRLSADYLFPPNGPGYLDPSGSLPANSDDYSFWDIFYTPFGSPNKPDFAAPFGAKTTASAAGVTAPANSSPVNPQAYWDSRNPAITQSGTNTAFIIGPGTAGNIYSFAAATGFTLNDNTTYNNGLVLFQFQTEGSTVDLSSIILQYTNASNQLVSIPASQYLTEYQAASVTGQGFSTTNRTALEWNLSGLNVKTFAIVWNATAASMSMQQVSLDTSANYASTVPQARTWTAAGSNLAWSTGVNWQQGASSVENGNVFFNESGTASINLDANHTVGQVVFQTPNNATIGSIGNFTLTPNTGITTTFAATGTYIINSKYAFGDYNVFDLAAGAVKLNGVVSGNNGFFKKGEGTLELNGNNTFVGGIGQEGGTLRLSGTNTYTGGTMPLWGTLLVAGNALNGVAGPLGNDSAIMVLGVDSATFANQSVPDPAAIVLDGNFNFARSVQMAPGTFKKILGAQNAAAGATFNGPINLALATDVHLNAAAATDVVTFSGGITGGVASTVSAPSNLTIDGLGTIVLTGSNSYSNDTVVGSGTLRTGITLGKVTVNAGGRLAAGSSATTLNNALTISSLISNVNGYFAFKLNSSTAQSDLIKVTSALTLNNTNLTLTDLAGSNTTLSPGTQLTLLTYPSGSAPGIGSGTAVFYYNGTQLLENATFGFGANAFRINYATGGTAITLTSVASSTITSALTAQAIAGTTFTYTITASGSPTSYNATGLPAGLNVNTTTGVISGTPSVFGTFNVGLSATTPSGPVSASLVLTISSVSFAQWTTNFSVPGGPSGIPFNDGVPNFLKYLFDINPTHFISAADALALPQVGLDSTTTPGKTYLTLTYRRSPYVTGLQVAVQTSTTLSLWQTVTPDITNVVSTNTTTGDATIKVWVDTAGAPREYIRLQVAQQP